MPNIAQPQKILNSHAAKPSHDKYNDFDAELKLVQAYLTTQLATATMVAVALDIYRPNLCRYKDMLTKQGVLAVVCVSKCRITGFQAQYLTCSPDVLERLKR